ncbi:hypothetical protein BpHYR1_014613 [Brachionus plicatilis]|uniref:Uncharacterized protein n=1 Tax=Brachionus plicatilis TaxID=10195 RepID=A0A3M7QHK9_BRAPC|nr:hypothetical protein BpHYR1_014613 [Brachionus plicatilis]
MTLKHFQISSQTISRPFSEETLISYHSNYETTTPNCDESEPDDSITAAEIIESLKLLNSKAACVLTAYPISDTALCLPTEVKVGLFADDLCIWFTNNLKHAIQSSGQQEREVTTTASAEIENFEIEN